VSAVAIAMAFSQSAAVVDWRFATMCTKNTFLHFLNAVWSGGLESEYNIGRSHAVPY